MVTTVTSNITLIRAAAVLISLTALPAVAGAQSAPQPTQAPSANQSGPMVLEEIHQRFTIEPAFKVSKLDDQTAELVGAQGGAYVSKSLMIGAGLYTLTNGANGRGLTYGGAVVGWEPWQSRAIGLNLRGLIGAGQGTASEAVSLASRRGVVTTTRLFSDDFFVAEPQVEALVRLTARLHLAVGGGYRFIGSSFDRSRFEGASGSIGLRVGSGQ